MHRRATGLRNHFGSHLWGALTRSKMATLLKTINQCFYFLLSGFCPCHIVFPSVPLWDFKNHLPCYGSIFPTHNLFLPDLFKTHLSMLNISPKIQQNGKWSQNAEWDTFDRPLLTTLHSLKVPQSLPRWSTLWGLCRQDCLGQNPRSGKGKTASEQRVVNV